MRLTSGLKIMPSFIPSLYNNDAKPGPITSRTGEVLRPYGALDPTKRYPEKVDEDAVVIDSPTCKIISVKVRGALVHRKAKKF